MTAGCKCHPQGPVLGPVLSNDLGEGMECTDGAHGWSAPSASLRLILSWGWGVADVLEGTAADQRDFGGLGK